MRYRKHWGKYLFIGDTPEWKPSEDQYKMFSYDPRNLPVPCELVIPMLWYFYDQETVSDWVKAVVLKSKDGHPCYGLDY